MIGEQPVVYLIGAGPGDPELMTVKAFRLLSEADVVVYDRLVGEEILQMIPPGAMKICVGKQPRNHPVPQDEINRLLVRLAKAGRKVVRLKGGDPFIFGRGSEEAAALVAEGVRYEAVPGITAAAGCAASLGIPLTHRGVASGLRFVTGHCREDRALDFDWDGLADPDTTLVIYMGMANIAQIAEELLAHGLSPEMPVAAINNGTTAQQRHVVSRLDRIVAEATAAEFEGPVLFIVGRVIEVAEALGGLDAASPRDRHEQATQV
jgi:uroporphyrin-III C-methyltransferase